MLLVVPYAAVTIISYILFVFALRFRGRDRLGFALFLLLSISAVSIFAGMRSLSVGLDTVFYAQEFIDEHSYSLFDFSQYSGAVDSEIGYLIWMRFIGIFSDDVRVFFMVTTFVQMASLAIAAVKKTEKPSLVYLLFLLLVDYSFFFFMNLMRQGLACCILLWAGFALIERRRKSYFVLVLLATTFHVSSIGFLALAFLLLLKNKSRTYLWTCFIITFVLVFSPHVLYFIVDHAAPRYLYYFEMGHNSNQQIGFGTLLKTSLCVFVVLGCYYVIRKNEKAKGSDTPVPKAAFFYGVVVLIGAALLLGMINLGIFERLSLSYLYFLPFAVSYTICNLTDNKIYQRNMTVAVLAICSILFCYRLYASLGGITPYTWG